MSKKVSLFDKYQKQLSFQNRDKNSDKIFFELNFDSDKNAYIKIINIERQEIENLSSYHHEKYSYILNLIYEIKEKNKYSFNWLGNNDKCYLYDNEYLIQELLKSDSFVDDRFRAIKAVENETEVYLLIEGTTDLTTSLHLYSQNHIVHKTLFLSQNYAYSDARIYKISPLGKNFKDIYLLEDTVKVTNLENFLSIIYSNFDNISISYKDYQVVKAEDKKIQPALIFEKFDDDFLYLKLSKGVQGYNHEIFETYLINKLVIINDVTKTISISEVHDDNIYMHFEEFEKILSKYKKALNDKNNYYILEKTFIIQDSLAKELIYKEINSLLAKYIVIGIENLKNFNLKAVKPKLSLAISHGIDFLEGSATIELDGESFDLNDFLNNYNKNSFVTLSNGTNAIVSKTYIDKLKRLFKRDKDKIKLSFFDLPIIEDFIDEKVSSEVFNKSKEIINGFNKITEMDFGKPRTLAVLRSYQDLGYKWLKYLSDNSFGGCLADDMGLGKTVQTIALLSNFYPEEKTPSLIVMPKSLLFNWENELRKFSPDITFYSFYGLNRNMKEAKTKNLILTTYSMLRNEIDKFRDEDFFYVVLDESQNIKTSTSQISRAVMLLKAKHKLSLSGTPIENNLGELYSLFRFLNPAMFGTQDEFNKNYTYPIQKENDKEASNELRKKVYPFILRRLKKDVLKELPEKIEQTLFVEMSSEQKEFYEQRRLYYYKSVREQISNVGINKTQFYILQAMSELRQIASIPEAKSDNTVISPKREVLMENIAEVIANDHKVLIFANFLSVVELVSKDLEAKGIKHLIMTGATKDRGDLVNLFQNDPTYKVFLMTLKTGGLGLNLTAADFIFIFDPWWNKAAENQAIDRAHRIGQDKTVFSYKLITKDTIEEKMLQLQEKKIELFDSIISSDGPSLKSLDENDIEFILGG